MNRNTVTDNAKRTMAKATVNEFLQMIESSESKTITREELLAHLEQFSANLSENKLEKTAEGKDIQNHFWGLGTFICADSGVALRKLTEDDREPFLQMKQEYSAFPALMKEESYRQALWEQYLDAPGLIFAIVKDDRFVGYCGIEDTSTKPWEICIELSPERRRQGIGTAAIAAMLDALGERLGAADFKARIFPDNVASQGLVEKLGAKPNGISELSLHDEEAIWRLEEESLHLIDDSLIAVAQKFDVEPRKLLSHVLEYSLRWPK